MARPNYTGTASKGDPYVWDLPPNVEPIDPPIYIGPYTPVCPSGYDVAGYDENGNPLCVRDFHPIDPVWPPVCPVGTAWNDARQQCEAPRLPPEPTCMPGAIWDAQRGVCVSADPTVYVDPVDEFPPEYPVDCLPGSHPERNSAGQLVCVADVIQTVGTPVVTPVEPSPHTTPPGILDSILDADGKLFGFEPIYVIGAAAVAGFFLLSGGGKK